MIALVASVAIILSFSSCESQLEDELTLETSSYAVQYADQQEMSIDSRYAHRSSTHYGIEAIGFPFGNTDGEYSHGIPNETIYKFYVANPPSNLTKVEVIFEAPDWQTYDGFLMIKNSSGNFRLNKSLSQAGRYWVKYKLYYSNGSTQIQDPYPNYVDNTKVSITNNVVEAFWVFNDNSSPSSNSTYRTIVVDGNAQKLRFKWLSGEDDGRNNGGYGNDEGTHSDVSEKYANDYNLYLYDWTGGGATYPSADKGSSLFSPLDGRVVQIQTNASATYGKYVVVEQWLGDKKYQSYLGHLNSISVNVGDYVRGGQSVIGTLGDTGATASHLHLNFWDRTSGKISVNHSLILPPE